MIDKYAQEMQTLVQDDAELCLKGIANEAGANKRLVRLEQMDEYTLILTIHRQQMQQVLTCLRSKGIEAYPEEETGSDVVEYDKLYIPTLTPQTDIVRYQKVLDDAD